MNNSAIKKVEDICKRIKGKKKEDSFENVIDEIDNLSKREREKIERQKEREFKYNEKVRLKAEKMIEKENEMRLNREKREIEKGNKEQEKFEKKDKRRNSGLVTAVAVLSTFVIGLSVAFTYFMTVKRQEDIEINNTYEKNFFDTVSRVNNMDVSLSKLIVTKDKTQMQTYLVDTAINSEVAESDIQSLPLEDENKYYTTKIINQIGDFSKYLNKKLILNQEITEDDYEILYNLYYSNLQLKNAIERILNGSENFSFSEINNGEDNVIIKSFSELENLSVQYPELIYDGPFSDAKEGDGGESLGNLITDSEAKDIFNEIFSEYNLTEVKNDGESNGNFNCYNLSAKLNGGVFYAQISKNGGKLLTFSYEGSCKDVNYESDYVIEKSREFLEKMGLDNMKSVWYNLSNNVYTINFVYNLDGVIIYPDMVKVRVCAETGMIIGIEATSYYKNHKERVLDRAEISVNNAFNNVSDNIDIESYRLCVIPLGENSETLCYEFYGTSNEQVFYVYISATTGRQVEMFKVVESTEGEMLI